MTESRSENPVAAAHAKAYRAYLQVLKESLDDVDIEAVKLPSLRPNSGLATYFTYFTYYTYYTYHTINTINTISSVSTESSIE